MGLGTPRKNTLGLGTPGTFWGRALQAHSDPGTLWRWALQGHAGVGHSGVGHSSDTLWGWALQKPCGVGFRARRRVELKIDHDRDSDRYKCPLRQDFVMQHTALRSFTWAVFGTGFDLLVVCGASRSLEGHDIQHANLEQCVDA